MVHSCTAYVHVQCQEESALVVGSYNYMWGAQILLDFT